MTDRLIGITTALAVMAVAVAAAIISYQHASELVSSHGESCGPGVLETVEYQQPYRHRAFADGGRGALD